MIKANKMIEAENFQNRKLRTRTLIQAGGLVSLSGLLELCDIWEGEDLQKDFEGYDKAATLLGILMDAKDKIAAANSDENLAIFRRRGKTLLKQSTAKVVYQK